jgi:hypothetical protein
VGTSVPAAAWLHEAAFRHPWRKSRDLGERSTVVVGDVERDACAICGYDRGVRTLDIVASTHALVAHRGHRKEDVVEMLGSTLGRRGDDAEAGAMPSARTPTSARSGACSRRSTTATTAP